MMTPEALARPDFIQVAVHEVAHALQCSFCNGIDIFRNLEGADSENKAFSGRTYFRGPVSLQLAIAGELANYLHCSFTSENGRPEWPDDFEFWTEEFVEFLELGMERGSVSETDSADLIQLSSDELFDVATEAAAALRSQWPDLLRLVGLLVEQLNEYPAEETYGFTDGAWRDNINARPQNHAQRAGSLRAV